MKSKFQSVNIIKVEIRDKIFAIPSLQVVVVVDFVYIPDPSNLFIFF